MLNGVNSCWRARWSTLGRISLVPPRRQLLTLAIETSCDDTSVAILEKHDIAAHSSKESGQVHQAQLHFHEKVTAANTGLGGIHPLEALESHRVNLANLVSKAIDHLPVPREANAARYRHIESNDGKISQKPDFISVTRGPGMRSNLNTGIDTAKGLATAWRIPLVGVHHMQAHALTPRLVHALNNTSNSPAPIPAFPFLTLLVSGGHTMLLNSTSLTSHTTLVNSLDNAIGDCLDKCGRSILPSHLKSTTTDTAYAKHLSDYAFPTPSTFDAYPIPTHRHQEIDKPANEYGWEMQLPLTSTRDLNFSFAGFPSQVSRLLAERPDMSDSERLLLAQTTIGRTFEHLASRTIMAIESLQPPAQLKSGSKSKSHKLNAHVPPSHPSLPTHLVISGGVASNSFLRHFLRATLDARGYKHMHLVFPPVELCTDNAAMIAWAGMEMFEAGWKSEMSVSGLRKWGMDPGGEDGGVLGVGGWVGV